MFTLGSLKNALDFLLVLTELFSLSVTAEAVERKYVENRRFRSNAVSLKCTDS